MAGTKKQKVTNNKRDESRKSRHKQKQKLPKKLVEVPQSKSKTSHSQYSQLSKSQHSKLAADPRLKQLPVSRHAPQKHKTSGRKDEVEKYQQQKQDTSHKKKKREKRHEKDTSAKSQASSQTTQKLQKAPKERARRESKNSNKEERVRDKQHRREKRDKEKKKEKEKERKEKSKPRKSDHVDLTIPTDSSRKVKPMRRSQLLEPKPIVPTPPITAVAPIDWSKRGDVAAQPLSFNLNEVLRIGGVLGRYGMDRKRREAFDWLASHPLEAAEGRAEAVYNVRVAVGDLPMSRLLVQQVLRLLVEKGEVAPEEYQRHFSMLEQNITDQAMTISQFGYFINMHCEKYKHRPIVTFNNSNSNSNK